MMKKIRPLSIADMPVQFPASPATDAEARGRFFNSGNAFNMQLSTVPDRTFTAEPRQAFDPATPTGLIGCDISGELDCRFAATTPLILAYYAKIRANETLSTDFTATGTVAYVIRGGGSTQCSGETIFWQAGDLIILPGGEPAAHLSRDQDSVLWIVTNEPQLAFENLRAPARGMAPTKLVHFRANEITRQIDYIYEVGGGEEDTSSALVFSAEEQQATHNILPTLTVAMNSLPPGMATQPHRHNSAAVTLIVRADQSYSLIDGHKRDWLPWATIITPAGSVHSHHNNGRELALFLIVQDGGIYYHARAMGFELADHPK